MLLYLVTGLLVHRAAKRWVEKDNELLAQRSENIDLISKNIDLDIADTEKRLLLQDMGRIIKDNFTAFAKAVDNNPYAMPYDYKTLIDVKGYFDRIVSEEKEEGS